MKINVERLIGVTQECFDNEQSYRLECMKKDWWKRTQQEKDSVAWHERNCHCSNSAVSDLCAILNINGQNLYTIARLARKWEKKRKWQYCFPSQEHTEQILKYLAKNDPFEGAYICYVHWNINNKAEEAAKKAS